MCGLDGGWGVGILESQGVKMERWMGEKKSFSCISKWQQIGKSFSLSRSQFLHQRNG